MQTQKRSDRIVAATRIQPPTYFGRLVARDRLIDLLRANRSKRLALIHAPAGFGKTTLAMQWQRELRAEGVPTAWISLDRDDNDVFSFLGSPAVMNSTLTPNTVFDRVTTRFPPTGYPNGWQLC
ncbi:hypothetical protein AWC05_19805 [Mycobacterium florentinum]|uniref:Orc1-like AAA ATPase domain-containing protein n=1 Tax=Mycobacterium florentinum TaxID=292462 RepID=A0A1X1UA42_MYCFL|nr:hypothetical protein [Mycobacterium florentinum]MCV7411348.1 hypothetical protein [Mycobacterium florentinum]ORV53666.1 hypothetical protein AWC05_19805 [Mycobacterium florentinum]BBX80704.1 hypothetical protein MFLOJ_44910 [Mycobacterium florentinum]